MALSDILQRFRRIWVPPGGPAGAAGIPVDQRLELTTELEELFSALDQLEAESAQILEVSGREAETIRAAGQEEADRILAEGRARAGRERLRVARRRRADARDSMRRRLAEAREEADRTRRSAAEREPGLVSDVVACILSAAGPVKQSAKARDAAVVGRG